MTLLLTTPIRADEKAEAVIQMAYNICANPDLSMNDRYSLLADAGWATTGDMAGAAHYSAEYAAYEASLMTMRSQFGRIEETARDIERKLRSRPARLQPLEHADWPGTLIATPRNQLESDLSRYDDAEGGVCHFFSPETLPLALVERLSNSSVPDEPLPQFVTGLATTMSKEQAIADASGRPFNLMTDAVLLDTETIKRTQGIDIALRFYLRTQLGIDQ